MEGNREVSFLGLARFCKATVSTVEEWTFPDLPPSLPLHPMCYIPPYSNFIGRF